MVAAAGLSGLFHGRRHHAPDLLAALAGERAEPADAAPSAPVLVG
jgi:hypothetical protein